MRNTNEFTPKSKGGDLMYLRLPRCPVTQLIRALVKAAILSRSLLPGVQTVADFIAHHPHPTCSLVIAGAIVSCAWAAQ